MKSLPLLVIILILTAGAAMIWQKYQSQRELFQLASQIIEDEGYVLFQFAVKNEQQYQLTAEVTDRKGNVVKSHVQPIDTARATIALHLDEPKRLLSATVHADSNSSGFTGFEVAESPITQTLRNGGKVQLNKPLLVIHSSEHQCEVRVEARSN